MIKFLTALLAIFTIVGGAGRTARADLAAYLRKPEPAYKWEKRGQTSVDGGTVYDLHLVSQTWQGMAWEHRIQIFRPDKVERPGFCVLLNTGGGGSDRETAMGMPLAKAAGTVLAILYNVPNQPLYGGKKEDELVVHTWLKYLETGDESWPLHFPMAKSVLKAMDAVQSCMKEEGQAPVEAFLITGASKRGWTAWLAGASRDPRIKAIAPMVIDTLNIPAQIPHQLEAFGKPSEQVGDYTKAGLEKTLLTKEGKRLLDLTDPYSFRDVLTLPKLIILGTNDRYWAQDALNLYWDGLKGPKWIMYVPNSGHGLEDKARVAGTLAAFARTVAEGGAFPKLRWEYRPNGKGTDLLIGSDAAAKSARLFRAQAPTRDFRDAKWTSEPMVQTADGFTGRLDDPAEGYAAMFGEVTYERDGKPYTLTTQIRIVGGKPR